MIGSRLWGAWKKLDPVGRARWAAAVSALAGLAVHSLVDDFFPFPAVGVTAMLLLAFVFAGVKVDSKTDGIRPLWLLVPALGALVFGGLSLPAAWKGYEAVVLGNSGDWQEAANRMEEAAKMDPGEAFYRLEAGYAFGRVGDQNPENYKVAIEDYRRGIEMEPVYGLNYANLGALYWVTGQKAKALDEMRIATRQSPDAWLIWLNLGAYEEDTKQAEQAGVAYGKALMLEPRIAGSYFWSISQIRMDALSDFEQKRQVDADENLDGVYAFINGNNLEFATKTLADIYKLNDQNVGVYTALGRIALESGDLLTAEKYVQAALWVEATSTRPKVEALLLGARIAEQGGDLEAASLRYRLAFDAVRSNTSYGWGSGGWSPYAWFVFQKPAFDEDTLPQLERADITTEVATQLLRLGDLYEKAGQLDEAEFVRSVLADYSP